MAVRLSQETVEDAGAAAGSNVRLSQVAAETAFPPSATVEAHVSQLPVETGLGASTHVRVSQIAIEYVVRLDGPRVSQMAVETDDEAPAHMRVSQIGLEVAGNFPVTAEFDMSQVSVEPGIVDGARKVRLSTTGAELSHDQAGRHVRLSQLLIEYCDPLNPPKVPGGITPVPPPPIGTITQTCITPATMTQTCTTPSSMTTSFPAWTLGVD